MTFEIYEKAAAAAAAFFNWQMEYFQMLTISTSSVYIGSMWKKYL